VRDKSWGPSSRQVDRPAREAQQAVCHHVAPSGTGTSEPQRSASRQADPARRSQERLTSARQLYDGSNHPDSDSLQRH
jgi:hypothetical protein